MNSKKESLDAYTSAYLQQFKFYDENLWYLKWYANRMCGVIRKMSLSSVLSLGIGHRAVSEMLMKEMDYSVKQYRILEGSPEIIESFRKDFKVPNVDLVETYFEDYKTDQKFDAIEMGFVLEHVDDPLFVLEKFKKLLTPGGRLFVAVPNARSLHRLIGHEAGMLDNVYRLSPQDLELGHKRYFDLQKISKMLLEAGYSIVNIEGLMLKPITGDQLKKLEFKENVIEALFKIGVHFPEIANCIYLEATTQ